MRGLVAVVASLGVGLLFAVPAMGFGPNADTSSTTTDPAVIACAGPGDAYTSGVVASQTDRGVQAGGGPKSTAPAPANCDHFWQTPVDAGGAGAIGNGWPPPPFSTP
jgi:hypothetical protein